MPPRPSRTGFFAVAVPEGSSLARLIVGGTLALMFFSGCAGSGALHPHRGEKGVLVPVEDPDGLIPDRDALTLYLGDLFNARRDGGRVLFGEKLEKRLRQYQGIQVTEICRSFPCYARAAAAWKRGFILEARVRKDDDRAHPGGLLVLTRWSVSPLFPKTTVPVRFPIDRGAPLALEPQIDRAISLMMVRMAPRPKGKIRKDLSDEIADLLARGKTELALRKGEEAFTAGRVEPDSFYISLYSLEMSAGKPRMAMMVGERAIALRRISAELLLRMVRDAREARDPERERNLLFEGLSLFPNDREFWRGLVHQDLRDKHYAKALSTIRLYQRRNPPRPGHSPFVRETYAALVGLGRGDEADLWFRKEIDRNWMEGPRPSLVLAHAVIERELQKGEWGRAEKVARLLVARGVRSTEIYRDWMTALGAMGNPIGEVHAGRQAIEGGYGSGWIRSQVTFLEQKGY